jgi:hypothetical protein
MPDLERQSNSADDEEQHYLRVVRDGSPDERIQAWRALAQIYQAQGRPGASRQALGFAERLTDERSFSTRLTSAETGAILRGIGYLVLGLALTVATYWIASTRGEGRYIILYGPIVVGLLLLWWGISRFRRH